MISLDGVKKTYGNYVALEDINFEINKGDIVGLLGPNGAGKTTTMRIMTGYLVSDNGSVKIDGKNILNSDVEAKSQIGYMPESNALYKDLLVKEFLNLTLDLNNIPKSKRKSRIDFVVKAVGIEDKYYRPIGELSKGYKQRVGIASALLNDPKVLILDEPTEGLDPNQRKEIRKLIKEIGKDRTVIISTHVMQEVEAMCNRIIIINKGKVIADGSKKEVLELNETSNKIFVELKGSKIKSIMKSAENFEIIDSETGDNGETFELGIDDEKPDKAFKELSEMIAKNNWIVYKLESKASNLENVFDKLTR